MRLTPNQPNPPIADPDSGRTVPNEPEIVSASWREWVDQVDLDRIDRHRALTDAANAVIDIQPAYDAFAGAPVDHCPTCGASGYETAWIDQYARQHYGKPTTR